MRTVGNVQGFTPAKYRILLHNDHNHQIRWLSGHSTQ